MVRGVYEGSCLRYEDQQACGQQQGRCVFNNETQVSVLLVHRYINMPLQHIYISTT